jgi:hypothetical protein
MALGIDLPNFLKVAVAAETVLKAGCSRHAIRDQRFTAIIPFLDQRVADAEAVALDRRA